MRRRPLSEAQLWAKACRLAREKEIGIGVEYVPLSRHWHSLFVDDDEPDEWYTSISDSRTRQGALAILVAELEKR
jgi:phosphopantetheinyl transferase